MKNGFDKIVLILQSWGMALLPYSLIEPVGTLSPLVVDSPHSGRIYPVDFAYSCPLNLLRQAEDAYVDEVVGGAASAGATVVLAEFPRTMIDVNRAENDIDPAALDGKWPEALTPEPMTLSGFGLVRSVCRNGASLYRRPLPVAEVQRRIEVYYRPYHECIRKKIAERVRKFGVCALIDVHSMPDRVESGVPRADFILGDRDGTSCSSTLTLFAQKLLQDMGYRVLINNPYKGREIVQRYGLAGLGAEALQVEMNRRLYLNEIEITKHQGLGLLRDNMTMFFRAIAAYMSNEAADKLAAE